MTFMNEHFPQIYDAVVTKRNDESKGKLVNICVCSITNCIALDEIILAKVESNPFESKLLNK